MGRPPGQAGGEGRLSTLPCTRIQRQYNACLHRREARPSSSFPVVALMTSMAESPTVQLTLKLGAFPGCRASALLMPATRQGRVTRGPAWVLRGHGPTVAGRARLPSQQLTQSLPPRSTPVCAGRRVGPQKPLTPRLHARPSSLGAKSLAPGRRGAPLPGLIQGLTRPCSLLACLALRRRPPGPGAFRPPPHTQDANDPGDPTLKERVRACWCFLSRVQPSCLDQPRLMAWG